MSHFPLSLLATTDPVVRDSTLFGLLVDSPGLVAVRHDIVATEGALRRLVLDATGVLEDVTMPLEHACLSCAVREDALPTLARLTDDGRWTSALLALPVSAETLPAARALTSACSPGGQLEGAYVSTVAAAVDLGTLADDLLGDDTLAERGLALTDDDERSVGEALAAQLEHADLVVTAQGGTTQGAAPTGSGLVDRLRSTGSRRVDGLHTLTLTHLLAGRHDRALGERRAHPLAARSAAGYRRGADDTSWTLELRSPLPFHPDRLLDSIESLGAGRLRARGVFHVADRPGTACLWDGAGGQLAVATLGPWAEVCAGTTPQTRIVIAGAHDGDGLDDRPRLREAFHTALATPEELRQPRRWAAQEDVLAPWLGARR
ncbi:GTP-binding protein [Antribacter sp. KLBMP9083]|uniref:GTP-binding protein n=1 Tax=Antribacter soli TaxID=2910976 RepID=A0AA41QDS0_9MICO|nr:GTP-binding protein [Antribacter soli]MCF4121578.1 GTP-binding protein [Antribacter soli]